MKDDIERVVKLDPPRELWVPVKIASFSFSLKESVQLSKLSHFMLSAILEHNANEADIADATNLAPLSIRTELHSLYTQKLLERDPDGKYILTEQSKLLLTYGKLVDELNKITTEFYFNTLSGKLKLYDGSLRDDEPTGAKAMKRLSELELACVDPVDIKDVLLEAFPFISEYNIDADHFLDSIVIEPCFEKGDKWAPMYLTGLSACKNNGRVGKGITANGYIVQKRCRAYYKNFEVYKPQLEHLKAVSDFDSRLLSEAGIEMLSRYEEYNELKKKIYIININPIDRSVKIVDNPHEESMARRAVFDLNELLQSEMNDQAIIEEVRGLLGIKYDLTFVGEEEHVPFFIQIPSENFVERVEETCDEG